MLLSILIAIVIGGVAGWLASLLLNRDKEQGIGLNIIVGIVGSLIGNAVLVLFGGGEAAITSFSLASFFTALLGSIILLAIVNLFTRGRIQG